MKSKYFGSMVAVLIFAGCFMFFCLHSTKITVPSINTIINLMSPGETVVCWGNFNMEFPNAIEDGEKIKIPVKKVLVNGTSWYFSEELDVVFSLTPVDVARNNPKGEFVVPDNLYDFESEDVLMELPKVNNEDFAISKEYFSASQEIKRNKVVPYRVFEKDSCNQGAFFIIWEYDKEFNFRWFDRVVIYL